MFAETPAAILKPMSAAQLIQDRRPAYLREVAARTQHVTGMMDAQELVHHCLSVNIQGPKLHVESKYVIRMAKGYGRFTATVLGAARNLLTRALLESVKTISAF